MRLAALAALAAFSALAAPGCKSADDSTLPVGGGGGGTGGMHPHPDASVDAGDGGGLAGRVCLLPDPRDQTTCATTGAGGITVALDTGTATTADDDSFSIAPPGGTDLVWTATGTNIVTSVMPYGTVTQIPAISTTEYDDLLGANGILLSQGQGSIMARVVQSNAPLAGATAALAPAAQYEPLYDGTSATQWAQSATGPHGTVWIAGAAAGSASLAVTPAGGTETSAGTVPVADGAVTFVVADIP